MDVPLNPLRSSAGTKTFERTPLTIQTDGSEEKGMKAIGFIIYNANVSELFRLGDVDYGSSSIEVELYAIFLALSFELAQG